MASVKRNTTIKEYQNFTKEVYGLPNDRYFSLWDMITNVERFVMRGLKGIRKKDREKTKINLLIAFSWFMSMMNQLHIDIESEAWKRFPYLCSYCASCPCSCKERKIKKRERVPIDENKRPKTLEEFQRYFKPKNIFSNEELRRGYKNYTEIFNDNKFLEIRKKIIQKCCDLKKSDKSYIGFILDSSGLDYEILKGPKELMNKIMLKSSKN